MSTLCDSLKLMQIAFCGTTDSGSVHLSTTETPPTQEAISSSSVEMILQKAIQRFSKASLRLKKKQKQKKQNPSTMVVVDVEPLEEDDLAELLANARYGASFTMVNPIRIVSDAQEPQSANQQDQQEQCGTIARRFGIILYNHGLASWLLSLSSSCSASSAACCSPLSSPESSSSSPHQNEPLPRQNLKQQKYADRAQKSLQMAQQTFFSSWEQQEQQEDDQETSNSSSSSVWEEMLVVLLAMLTVHVLSLLFQSQCRSMEFKEALQALAVLDSQMEEREHLIRDIFNLGLGTVAAAA
ncbi:hypothetical protein ACA910_008823 [Epithemia clementina (nom. ined.)]